MVLAPGPRESSRNYGPRPDDRGRARIFPFYCVWPGISRGRAPVLCAHVRTYKYLHQKSYSFRLGTLGVSVSS